MSLESSGVGVRDGRVVVGALTPHADLAASAELRGYAPALWDAARAFVSTRAGASGSFGEACALGDPASGYAAVMLALDATFTIAAATGERTVAARDFVPGTLGLGGGEKLTEVGFAPQPHSAYVKLERPAADEAPVGAAASLALNGSRVAWARVAVSGAGDRAFRAREVEIGLSNADTHDPDAISAACAALAEFHIAMADVNAARAVTVAASR